MEYKFDSTKVDSKETGAPGDKKPTKTTKTLWKKYSDVIENSYKRIIDRRAGRIKSLKTSWKGFNKIGLNGIEWQALYIISTRPGVGKTLIANTIAKEVQELNKDQDFSVLHFQFEMLAENLGIRELSAGTNLDVRYIQSAEDDGMPRLTSEDLDKLRKYSKEQGHRKEYVIDKALTVKQIKKTAIDFFIAQGRKPVFITLDHTLLVKQDASERSKQETLQNLSTTLTELKNAYPFTFIILSQLNRSIDDSERQRPGMLSNYPTDADIYGSDWLMQAADVVIAYNRPAKYNLSVYGPLKYEIGPTDKFLLAMHILKNRFGTLDIQWYMADYPTMSIKEVPAPGGKMKFSSS